MRLQFPLYEGDSIIRYGRTTPSASKAAPRQAHSTPEALQRNMASAPPVSALDLATIEARARALRAAAIADLVSRAWSWLGAYFERAHRQREEEYLAQSQNHAELERRMRKLERQRDLLHV